MSIAAQGTEHPNARWAAVCIAGAALATAGTWVRFALTGALRIDTHAWSFVAASATSGVGLILLGIGSFRIAAAAHRWSWRALWALVIVVQTMAWGSLALTSSDVFTNLSFGMLARNGLSPYAHSPSELRDPFLLSLVPQRWVNDPSPYGPLFHPIIALAVWLGEKVSAPFWGPFFVYKALLLTAVLAALALAAAHLTATQPAAEARKTFCLLALGPLIAWEVTGQGHNDGLLFLAIVGFLVAATAKREALAVLALAAGVAVKYALAPLLGLYLLLIAKRSVLRALGLSILAAAVAAAAFTPEWRSLTIGAVTPMIGGEAARHTHSLTDLVCLILDGLSLPVASLAAYRVLSACSTVLCLAVLAWTAWRARTLADACHGYVLFLFALYLSAPWFQPWYLVWVLPFLIVEPDPLWRRFIALFAVVTVAQWSLPLDPITSVLADGWAAWQIWRLFPGPDKEIDRADRYPMSGPSGEPVVS